MEHHFQDKAYDIDAEDFMLDYERFINAELDLLCDALLGWVDEMPKFWLRYLSQLTLSTLSELLQSGRRDTFGEYYFSIVVEKHALSAQLGLELLEEFKTFFMKFITSQTHLVSQCVLKETLIERSLKDFETLCSQLLKKPNISHRHSLRLFRSIQERPGDAFEGLFSHLIQGCQFDADVLKELKELTHIVFRNKVPEFCLEGGRKAGHSEFEYLEPSSGMTVQ